MKQLDVLIITPNDKKNIYSNNLSENLASAPPYWLAILGGWLKDRGFSVALMDAEAEDLSPEIAAERVKYLNPRLVGIVATGTNLTASTWKMHGTGILATAIKRVCNVPIFAYGYHVSAIPQKTLQQENIDFVILGEGLGTAEELLQAVGNEQAYSKIHGLWYKLADGTIGGNNQLQVIQDLDEVPYDGFDLLPKINYRNHFHFSFDDLSRRNTYGTFMSSLGCPYQCKFCAIGKFSGCNNLRLRSVEKTMEEIEYWVTKRDAYFMRIFDECFNFNRAHVVKICNAIIERGFKINMWCNARTELVDEELLELMHKAGIRWMGYGIETGSQRIRGNVQKAQYGEDTIRKVTKMTQDAGMYICANLMVGLPGEDLVSMMETLQLAREMCWEWPNFYCTMAYPGSKLYEEAVKKGVKLPDSWLGYAQLGYETEPLPTESLSSAEILAFRDYAFDAYFRDNTKYFNMIEKKFGSEVVAAIKSSLNKKLPRKLLGD